MRMRNHDWLRWNEKRWSKKLNENLLTKIRDFHMLMSTMLMNIRNTTVGVLLHYFESSYDKVGYCNQSIDCIDILKSFDIGK